MTENILERLAHFYAGLVCNDWNDFLNGKPKGFDDMPFYQKIEYTNAMRHKIDQLLEDPWNVIKIWTIQHEIFNVTFDEFMESELNHHFQKQKLNCLNYLKNHFFGMLNKWNNTNQL